MSQSATELVKDVLEKKMAQSETGSRESRSITRSELEDVVREGVREGISEYERERVRREGREWSEDAGSRSDGSAADDSSGGSGVGALLVLGVFVAAVLYLRRRSQGGDRSSGL